MKAMIKTVAMACLAAMLLALVACSTTGGSVAVNTTNGDTVSGTASVNVMSNVCVGVTGSYATNGDWAAGIVVTFKSPPDAETTAAFRELMASGAAMMSTRSSGGPAYVLPKPDMTNPAVVRAMALARKAGAEVFGFN